MSDATQDRAEPIRVALSNDYELALLGLAQMLARHPSQVQVVDLTTLTTMPRPADVILFDTFGRLPDGDEKLRKVVAENAGKVVVYSWEDYPEEAALRNGAVGYLHKGLNAAELVAAIVAIHDGTPRREVDGDDEPVLTWPGEVVGLSQRESEMLELHHSRSHQRGDRPTVLPEHQHREDLHPDRLPQDRSQQPLAGGGVGLPERLPVHGRHRSLTRLRQRQAADGPRISMRVRAQEVARRRSLVAALLVERSSCSARARQAVPCAPCRHRRKSSSQPATQVSVSSGVVIPLSSAARRRS